LREYNRIVAYSRERGEYLIYSCNGGTPDRVWAWSGNPRQAANMVREFPSAEEFQLFWDGEEKNGGTPLYVT
jgi:hypothetical protein